MRNVRIAVCGAGISGATAARVLAQNGCSVTVFESGFGAGGRSSTRQTREGPEDGARLRGGGGRRYQFDHGAQYISTPKSADFADMLAMWRAEGFVGEWRGAWTVLDVTASPGLLPVCGGCGTASAERWVGIPRMNSIAEGLLNYEGIETRTRSKARVVAFSPEAAAAGAPSWSLEHAKTGASLGTFHWLVSSDRIMSWGRQGSALISAAGAAGDGLRLGFVAPTRAVASAKSLACMAAFTSPLPAALGDGIRFEGHNTLAWAARDSSKPGRARADGHECWVLHSTATAAKRIADEAGGRSRGRRAGVREVRAAAANVLLRDFGQAVQHTTGEVLPAVAYSVGHRWGAAFPTSPWIGASGHGQGGGACFVDAPSQFAACGDYFLAQHAGKVEGAALSGAAMARAVLDILV